MLNRYCKHTIAFDATAIAEALGDPIVTNMVLLGAAAYSADLPFSKQAFAKAIRRKVPSSRLKLNLAAFNAGYEEAKKLR
jgi:Pyruvate/2-oxoacid:ferredoxin oxidoreductase gamma subunit